LQEEKWGWHRKERGREEGREKGRRENGGCTPRRRVKERLERKGKFVWGWRWDGGH